MKIEIENTNGDVLFSHEEENNTIKKTVEEAVKLGADLRGAILRYANLRYANLQSANLQDAYLRGAILRDAYLQSANLQDANLEGAILRGADLRGAKHIPQSYINLCSRDILFVLSHLKAEVPFLKNKLIKGEVNGTQYEGECCCLIGTLAHKTDVSKICESIPFYEKGLHNYGEQWFFQIRKGDTPDNSQFAAHAVKLCDLAIKSDSV